MEVDVLINQTKLEKRIAEMAKQIEKDYTQKPIVLIGILKGSVMFLAQLAKNIKADVEIEFMELASYEGTQSAGKVQISKDTRNSIEGKDIILVEDIVDTGTTLKFLLAYMKQKNPNSIKIATMLSKPARRKETIDVDYIGFTIEDEFVVGYGLDYNEKYRNLPYIGILKENATS